MRIRRRIRRLIYAALFFTLASGCQLLRPCRAMTVVAVDAETKKPISGAEVHVSYPLTPPYRAPAKSSGTTGADGAAVVQAARAEEGLALEATAAGYLYEQKSFDADVVPAAAPFGPFAAPAPPVASLVLEMYAAPGPTIDLVLPPGYRGIVRVEVQPRDDIPCPPGLRHFRYQVPDTGEVVAAGPALLRRTPAIVAGYANGAPLASQVKDGEIGFLWIKSDGPYEIYVVGTPIERDSLRRSDLRNTRLSADDGPKPGRGHKGRRGGQPSSDSGGDAANP